MGWPTQNFTNKIARRELLVDTLVPTVYACSISQGRNCAGAAVCYGVGVVLDDRWVFYSWHRIKRHIKKSERKTSNDADSYQLGNTVSGDCGQLTVRSVKTSRDHAIAIRWLAPSTYSIYRLNTITGVGWLPCSCIPSRPQPAMTSLHVTVNTVYRILNESRIAPLVSINCAPSWSMSIDTINDPKAGDMLLPEKLAK